MQSATSSQGTRSFWWLSPGAAKLCLVAAASALFCVSACSRRSSPIPEEETLRIATRGTGEAPQVITASLFAESLLGFDWQGRPTERLASDWQWEDNGRILRLHLRPSVVFHDGTPVTADVVAAILKQEMAKPDTWGFEAVDRIESPDGSTVVIYLRTPDVFLIGALSGTLIVDSSKPGIGTGPFHIVSWKPTIEAERNEKYYLGRPGIARVKLVPYETPRAAWAGLMRGDVDVAHEVNRESLEFTEGASRVELYTSIRPFYIPLVFNLHHPILGRVEVRRALAEAINREEIVKQAMRGQGQVAEDPVWPSHWAYNAAARHYAYNPGAARLRLDAAGLPVRPASAGSGRMASRFQITCVFFSGDPVFERIALLLQRQVADVGVDLVLRRATWEELKGRVVTGEFETFLFQLTSGRSFDWTYRIWHSSPRGTVAAFQNSGYTGVDAVLDQLRQARTEPEIRAAVGDLRRRFYEDAPAAFLAWTQSTRAVDARFDVGERTGADIFSNLWRWHGRDDRRAAR